MNLKQPGNAILPTFDRLAELWRRVEREDGPDEALDLNIADAFGLGGVLDYTRSADAVDHLIEMVLAPWHPGMEIHSRAIRGPGPNNTMDWYYIEEITIPSSEFRGSGTTRARARLAAFLRCAIRYVEDQAG